MSTEHPEPLGDKEHWAIDNSWTWHGPAPDAPCGHTGSDWDVHHWRQVHGLTRADIDICEQCLAHFEGEGR